MIRRTHREAIDELLDAECDDALREQIRREFKDLTEEEIDAIIENLP